MMFILKNKFFPRLLREKEDETGGGEPPAAEDKPSLVGGDKPAPEGGEPEPEGSKPEGSEGKKSLLDSGDDEPSSDFETLVEPEAFKESLGDDFEITDEESFNKFLETVNNAPSREELAKSLLNVYSESLEATAKATEAAFEETQTQWQEQVKSDPTYGKDNLDKSLANAKTVAEEYGGKEFLQLLNLTGAGNNLSMIAFLNKVHAALPQEGEPVAGTPSQAQRTLADRLFPTAEGK